ncbi:hypothetical protein D2E25_1743 [Bifidobacterium goeldii]|uniref:Uncharacterized protein n=1 Tax=Bifidobacterium goeldii TaxID=2306975 RepID=A0A430FGB3_9BIFI|nr:hypothetical protein D2E25_1743 [Bifidobacterium goeldii]
MEKLEVNFCVKPSTMRYLPMRKLKCITLALSFCYKTRSTSVFKSTFRFKGGAVFLGLRSKLVVAKYGK